MPNYLGALRPFSVGAIQPRGYGLPYGNPRYAAALQRSNMMAGLVFPDIPGTPGRDGAMLPASFAPFSFALANGTSSINQTANPQTPFRGQRLSAVVVRNGTSANTTAPLLTQFLVGQKPIVTTATGVALETFNQNAYDTNLLMPPTTPGVIYSMNVNLTTALTTTDTLLALVSIIGSALL